MEHPRSSSKSNQSKEKVTEELVLVSVQRRHWGSGKVKAPGDELGGNVKCGVSPSLSRGVKY